MIYDRVRFLTYPGAKYNRTIEIWMSCAQDNAPMNSHQDILSPLCVYVRPVLCLKLTCIFLSEMRVRDFYSSLRLFFLYLRTRRMTWEREWNMWKGRITKELSKNNGVAVSCEKERIRGRLKARRLSMFVSLDAIDKKLEPSHPWWAGWSIEAKKANVVQPWIERNVDPLTSRCVAIQITDHLQWARGGPSRQLMLCDTIRNLSNEQAHRRYCVTTW